MTIRKKLLAVFLTAAVLWALSGTAVFAAEPELDHGGSVTIKMNDGTHDIDGGTVTLFQVGSLALWDGEYVFPLTEDFGGSGALPGDIESSTVAKQLADYALGKGLKGQVEDVKSGSASFDHLDCGLYLIVQETAAAGYYRIEPFLISVPSVKNGVYVYDVSASPKNDELLPDDPTPPETPETPVDPSKPLPPDLPLIDEPDQPGQSGGNTPGTEKLPQTGQLNWPIPVLAAMGLVLFSAGWMLRYGGKREDHEK